jgi:SNF2 family DNA or RNA helicase
MAESQKGVGTDAITAIIATILALANALDKKGRAFIRRISRCAFEHVSRNAAREELKRRFNADPVTDPLRILICTDAAREGINLQARCHELIHIDLPWNPARPERRNARAVLE